MITANDARNLLPTHTQLVDERIRFIEFLITDASKKGETSVVTSCSDTIRSHVVSVLTINGFEITPWANTNDIIVSW